MKQSVIYGASDDLIELDGEFSEEVGYSPDDDEKFYIAVSDGTLLECEYDGEWKFRVKTKGTLFREIVQSVGEDGEHLGDWKKYTSYSDLAMFDGNIKWMLVGNHIAK